jgi:hypothetical protein
MSFIVNIISQLTNYYWDDQIKEDVIGEAQAYTTHKNGYKILSGKPEEKITHGRNTWEGVNLIHLAQDTDRWRALVNVVMNLEGP